MEAPAIEICEYVVESIKAGWTMYNEDSVEQEFLMAMPIREVVGRHVWVWPLSYQDLAADHGDVDNPETDVYIHRARIGVSIGERYSFADDLSTVGDVPRAWVRDRIRFVWEKIYKPFRKKIPLFPRAITLADELKIVCDLEFLERQKAFWSEAEFEFQWMD